MLRRGNIRLYLPYSKNTKWPVVRETWDKDYCTMLIVEWPKGLF